MPKSKTLFLRTVGLAERCGKLKGSSDIVRQHLNEARSLRRPKGLKFLNSILSFVGRVVAFLTPLTSPTWTIDKVLEEDRFAVKASHVPSITAHTVDTVDTSLKRYSWASHVPRRNAYNDSTGASSTGSVSRNFVQPFMCRKIVVPRRVRHNYAALLRHLQTRQEDELVGKAEFERVRMDANSGNGGGSGIGSGSRNSTHDKYSASRSRMNERSRQSVRESVRPWYAYTSPVDSPPLTGGTPGIDGNADSLSHASGVRADIRPDVRPRIVPRPGSGHGSLGVGSGATFVVIIRAHGAYSDQLLAMLWYVSPCVYLYASLTLYKNFGAHVLLPNCYCQIELL